MTQDATSTPSDNTDTNGTSATEDDTQAQELLATAAQQSDAGSQGEQQAQARDQQDSKDAEEDKLGDSGKRALRAERQARRDAEQRLRELEAQVQQYTDRDKSELEKAQEAAKRYEQELGMTRTANARLMAAAIHNLPPDLIDLLGDGTEEEIDAKAKLLAEKLAAVIPPAPQPEPAASPMHNRPVESLTPGGQPSSAKPLDMNEVLRRMAGRT